MSGPLAVATSLLEYLHACPVCGDPRLSHYCRVPSLFTAGESIRYERCRGCGVVLRNPRLPAGERLARYEEGVLAPDRKALDPKSQDHYWYMMGEIRRRLPSEPGQRLLDFGCGAGGFLVEARAAGFEVMGLELSRDLARHVEGTYDIPVHQGLASDPALADERFDVIVNSQVFEHLLDPRETLQELRRLLRPGGLLLIEVPNLRHTHERLRRGSTMDDSHLFYFSAGSLSRMLTTGGFRVLTARQGLRPYRFFPGRARRLPRAFLGAGERLLSLVGLRSALSVLSERSE